MSSDSLATDFAEMTVKDLVLWTRPRATGIIVASLFAVLVVFGYLQYTVLTFVCRVLQVAMIVYGGLHYTQKAPIPVQDLPKKAEEILRRCVQPLVRLVEFLALVISWEDQALSRNVLVASVVVGFLGNTFSDLAMLLLITIAVFAGPIVYAKNKDAIDPLLNSAATSISSVVSPSDEFGSPVTATPRPAGVKQD